MPIENDERRQAFRDSTAVASSVGGSSERWPSVEGIAVITNSLARRVYNLL